MMYVISSMNSYYIAINIVMRVTLFYYPCLLFSFIFIYAHLFRSSFFFFFFLNDTAPPEIYPLPLHDALPIYFRKAPHLTQPRQPRSTPVFSLQEQEIILQRIERGDSKRAIARDFHARRMISCSWRLNTGV